MPYSIYCLPLSKGDAQHGLYEKLHSVVMSKGHMYHGFTAYYVQVIPKSHKPYDLPFTPSDNKTGVKAQSNPLIRIIDGKSFYALATGRPNALEELYDALPLVIEKLKPDYRFSDVQSLKQYFNRAYR
jgi:Eco47II restriction endonuclease